MSQADFRTDLAFTDERRALLDKHFYPAVSKDGRFVALGHSEGSLSIQRRCHVDCVVATQKGSVTVEEKIVRWKGRAYTAITVETHSNLERTGAEPIGDGWIATSVADYLLYAFEQEDVALLVWLFVLPKLREWFTPRVAQYAIADTPNSRYTTRCRVVPLDAIPEECVRVRAKRVG